MSQRDSETVALLLVTTSRLHHLSYRGPAIHLFAFSAQSECTAYVHAAHQCWFSSQYDQLQTTILSIDQLLVPANHSSSQSWQLVAVIQLD